jgi:transglutaminase-like putative cysteine protease
MTAVRAGVATRQTGAVSDLLMSGFLLLALALAFTGLHSLLSGSGWWVGAFGVMVVVFGASAIARYFLQRWWAGPAAGIVFAIIVLSLLFTSDSSVMGIIPTGGTITRVIQLSEQAADSIARQSIPAIPVVGIQFLLCWVVAALAILMDAMANLLRAPALVGIPLLIVVVAPSFVISKLADGLTFEITAAAYLLILLTRRRLIQPAVALPVAVIAVLGALVAPLFLPAVTPGGTNGTGEGILAESINPLINLGQDLRQGDPAPVLTYTTSGDTGEYLRLTTLDTFSGKQWEPTTTAINRAHTVSNIASPPGLDTAVKATGVSTTIQIGDASGTWLPAPYPAVTISGLKGDWFWQSNTLTIRSADTSTQGERYSVDSLDVEPSVQQLRAAPRDPGNPLAAVPAGLDPVVAATAKRVVGSAKTDFDKAVALQNWFRGGTFTYSTKAPVAGGYDGSGLSVIVPFLKQKEGYCVHFATTMAVMARTLGIPSRVAVGFLPGTLTHAPGSTTPVYKVTSSNLHAWPELYFQGVGWVRFEPTPGKGFEPNFPDAPGLNTTGGTTPTGTSTPQATSTPVAPKAPKLPDQGVSASTKSNLGSGAGPATVSIGWLAALVVLLLLIAPAVIRIGIRRGRLASIRVGKDAAILSWIELRESARDLGIDARETSTPQQLAEQLAPYLEKQPQASAALDDLRSLVEDDRFGLPGYRYFGDRLADNLVAVIRGLRASVSADRRLRATILPPTLVDRALGRRASRLPS